MARAIWVDANVICIVDNLSEDFFLKYLLSSISLAIRTVVSDGMNTLLRRLCPLSKTSEIFWSEVVSALSQTV